MQERKNQLALSQEILQTELSETHCRYEKQVARFLLSGLFSIGVTPLLPYYGLPLCVNTVRLFISAISEYQRYKSIDIELNELELQQLADNLLQDEMLEFTLDDDRDFVDIDALYVDQLYAQKFANLRQEDNTPQYDGSYSCN